MKIKLFDLSNLNDYEFEVLCQDIMQKTLDTQLHVFSRGVDEGIDICDKAQSPKILIQVKHYAGSTYSQLKSSLIKEIPKVQKHAPANYYVCTSLSLTRKNKIEIMNMFTSYIADISHVVDKNEINSFLEDEQNKDTVIKNYKLWLCASNVLSLVNNQNVFIDCTELMLDIEAQIKLFVETQAYRDALKILNEEKIIIIVGAPGVGKSTVSKMLLLHYASKGYAIRYVSNNDIGEIKKSVSLDPNKKEILLLDDFLGQHYLHVKDKQPNELKTLISFIEKSTRKKLILNSRITILNEAMHTFLSFRNIMEAHESNKYLLDLDKMSSFEKAKILYNHLYFNSLPRSYLAQIKANRNYFKIIKHKNYNPRIVEYVTKRRNYQSVPAQDYLNYIMRKLYSPEDVWQDEFRNRLDSADRILMNTLYSLSDTMIDDKVLEWAFNKRIIENLNQDTSVNQYKDAVIRLTDSLLKNIDDRGTAKLSVINPSINDYLLSELTQNVNEQITIIDNAVYFEQIMKAILSELAKEHFIKKLINDDLLKMKTLENSSFFYYIKSIIKFNIFNKLLTRKVRLALERAYTNLNYKDKDEYGSIIHKLFTGEFCDFYKLHNTFFSDEKMYFILKPMLTDDVIEFINAMATSYDLFDNDELKSVFKDLLVEKIADKIQDEFSDELSDIVSGVINKADDEDISGYMNDTSDSLDDAVWSKMEAVAYERFTEVIGTVDGQIGLRIDDFDISDMRYYLGISDTIKSILNEPDYDRNDYDEGGKGMSDDSLIVSMFER